MNSFFGIGILELFFIMIIALLVLGPERLPGALKEVAKYIRYFRNLSRELMAQFNEQFGDDLRELEDLHPQKLINEFIGEDEDKNTKKNAKSTTKNKPAAKPKTTSTAKSSTTANKAKTTTSSTTKTAKTSSTTNSEKAADEASDTEQPVADKAEADKSVSDKSVSDKPISDQPASLPSVAEEKQVDTPEEPQPTAENRILPPPLDKKAAGLPMGSIPSTFNLSKSTQDTKNKDVNNKDEMAGLAEVTTTPVSGNGVTSTDEANTTNGIVETQQASSTPEQANDGKV